MRTLAFLLSLVVGTGCVAPLELQSPGPTQELPPDAAPSLAGFTVDNDSLEFSPETPWRNLVGIRVETRSSPSWVAWREIEAIAR